MTTFSIWHWLLGALFIFGVVYWLPRSLMRAWHRKHEGAARRERERQEAAESKRKDAEAEGFHLNRQHAIRRIECLGGDRKKAEEIVDEILMQMSSSHMLDESAARYARDRAELRWSIFMLVLVAVAIGLGIFYWPSWYVSAVSFVQQCFAAS